MKYIFISISMLYLAPLQAQAQERDSLYLSYSTYAEAEIRSYRDHSLLERIGVLEFNTELPEVVFSSETAYLSAKSYEANRVKSWAAVVGASVFISGAISDPLDLGLAGRIGSGAIGAGFTFLHFRYKALGKNYLVLSIRQFNDSVASDM